MTEPQKPQKPAFDPTQATHLELSKTLINICTHLGKTGAALAQSRADYEALDEHRKVVLAGTYGHEGNVEERKNKAYLSTDYQTHMMAVEEARKKFYAHQAFYKALEAKFEAMRTIISLRKQEMNSGV